MSNLRICPINFFDSASLTESPALASTMPAANAQLTARDKVARSTSSASQTIKGAWGGEARIINTFAMLRHNAQGGLVQLLLYPNADWTGTPYDSTALTTGAAITSDSHDWGIAATSPDSVNDLLFSEAPYYLNFSNFTAKSFEIVLTSCDRSYWQVGRLWLGKYLEAPYNPKIGMVKAPANNDIQQRTKGGSVRARAGEKWRDLKIDMLTATDAQRALWTDLMSYVQLSRPVLVNVFPGVGGRQERDHIFEALVKDHAGIAWNGPFFNEATYNFTET